MSDARGRRRAEPDAEATDDDRSARRDLGGARRRTARTPRPPGGPTGHARRGPPRRRAPTRPGRGRGHDGRGAGHPRRPRCRHARRARGDLRDRPRCACARRSPPRSPPRPTPARRLLALHAADAADRSRLAEAERAASGARERLRSADDRSRAADHAELEARLGLESLREGVLVELAGLGEFGAASLGVVAPAPGSIAETPVTDGEGDRRAEAHARPTTDGRGRHRGPRDGAGRLRRALDRRAANRRATGARSPGPAASPLPRARRREPVRGRGIRRAQGAPRDARDAGLRPAQRDRQDARTHRRAGHDDRRPVPHDVRRPGDGLRAPVRAALRRRLRPALADRSRTTSGPPASRSWPGRPARSSRRWRCCRAASGR